MRRALMWMAVAGVAGGFIGCAQQQAARPQQAPRYEPSPEEFSHTVRYYGETLGIIARWYTGKTTNWQLILDANPGLRPERIAIGQQILIPRDLLVRSDALPREAVPNVGGESQATGGSAGAEPAPEAETVEKEAERSSVDEAMQADDAAGAEAEDDAAVLLRELETEGAADAHDAAAAEAQEKAATDGGEGAAEA
ncbi:MAG: LysM peptidoglycan-binding domain-containing protein, partial [Bdellovibrionales bacterium]|nr:LysM peptidoglycan-binding domain-containing protein [Bdellovibrionales bacterium]